MTLAELDLLESHTQQLDEELAAPLRVHQDAVQRLAAVPGFGVDSAQQIIAEVGPTATTFPTAKHLVLGGCLSWARRAPASTTVTGPERQPASASLALEGLVLEMLALVPRPEGVPERPPPAWLARAEDLLKNSFYHSFPSVRSRPRFGFILHTLQSLSVSQPGDWRLLPKLRVQFVCQRLAVPKSLCRLSCFADQSRFTRAFKQCAGIKPGRLSRRT